MNNVHATNRLQHQADHKVERKKSTRDTRKEDGVKHSEFDFYEILGLGEFGTTATQDQIKKYCMFLLNILNNS